MLEKDLAGKYRRMQIKPHFRNQAYGPSWSMRKLIWIKSYWQNHYMTSKYYRGQIITDKQNTVIDYILKKFTGISGFNKTNDTGDEFTILRDGRRIKSQETLQKIYNQSKDEVSGFKGRSTTSTLVTRIKRFFGRQLADSQKGRI